MSFQEAVRSQYWAAAEMLRQAVDECPGSLWNAPEHRNRFWQVAYHALFYTHLYLEPEAATFVPWAKHRAGYNELGKSLSGGPYTRDEILEYYRLCLQQVEAQTALLDPDAPSGFHWLPFTKLELQLYNIRDSPAKRSCTFPIKIVC